MATRPCNEIQADIDANEGDLKRWQPDLDDLLKNGNRGDLPAIQTLRNLIADINNKLIALKAEQIRNGCAKTTLALFDNQTTLSTSSVKRNDNVVRRP